MTAPGTKQKEESAETDHGIALVPLGAGYHQSPDVLAQGRAVDTGLLAESLIYYDRVLISWAALSATMRVPVRLVESRGT